MIRWLPPQPFVIYYTSLEYPLITKDSPYRLCSIFVRGTARQAFVGDKVAVSRCRQEVWDELEGGGTKYSNCIYYCLEAQSPLVGISFP